MFSSYHFLRHNDQHSPADLAPIAPGLDDHRHRPTSRLKRPAELPRPQAMAPQDNAALDSMPRRSTGRATARTRPVAGRRVQKPALDVELEMYDSTIAPALCQIRSRSMTRRVPSHPPRRLFPLPWLRLRLRPPLHPLYIKQTDSACLRP